MTGGGEQVSLGAFIRAQRQLANLSLRQLSAVTQVSNPYLSQVERDLHAPSVRVLKAIADALGVSPATLLAQAGLGEDAGEPGATDGEDTSDVDVDETDGGAGGAAAGDTEATIRADARLTEEQRGALIAVYRSYLGKNTDTGG